jgi:hypothetical protein
MLLVSPFRDEVTELTAATAEARNRCVAALAHELVVPHAAPGATSSASCARWWPPERRCTRSTPGQPPLLRVGARF